MKIKRPPYEKTVNVLLDAFNNKTLSVDKDTASIVGNLVAHAKEYSINKDLVWLDKDGNEVDPRWVECFSHKGIIKPLKHCSAEARAEIISTKYNVLELYALDRSFKKGKNRSLLERLSTALDTLRRVHDTKRVKHRTSANWLKNINGNCFNINVDDNL